MTGPYLLGAPAQANHSSTISRIISLASSGKCRSPPGGLMPEFTCSADKLENEVSLFFFSCPLQRPNGGGEEGGGVFLCLLSTQHSQDHARTLCSVSSPRGDSWASTSDSLVPSGFWQSAVTGWTCPCKPLAHSSQSDMRASLGPYSGDKPSVSSDLPQVLQAHSTRAWGRSWLQ